MTKQYATDQENFWSAEFGNQYIERNQSDQLFASNLAFFTRALKTCTSVTSILEIGANIGMNMRALKWLLPTADLHAVEINNDAAQKLKDVIPSDNITIGSILEYEEEQRHELVFTKGVLIHISPDHLESVYKKMAQTSSKYVLIGEYYNPTPVSLDYRDTGTNFSREISVENF